jgi:glycosyltransferase involved in cell wall biosynthesis
MLVSVVMPVYNAGNYLNEAIQSLLRQTYSNWELIAVDDGSTDNSWEMLSAIDDRRIKLMRRENGGQCAATNTGLEHISGDYVQFLDADDLMDSRKIELQVKALEKEPGSIAICKWAFFTNSVADASFKTEPVFFSGLPVEWLYRLWSYETMMPNHGYLIPRNIIEEAGKYYDERLLLNIDFEYFTRMALHAKKILYCEDAICYYRKGVAAAKTYKPKLEKRLSALQSRCMAIGYMLKTDCSEQARNACRMALTTITYTYPELLPYSKRAILDFKLGGFGRFGGNKFQMLSSLLGYENAIKIKRRLIR